MVDSTNLPEIDINQIATDLNGKMDRDGINASCPVVISRTTNDYGGVVEIWSDGYCVQTGNFTASTGNGWKTISLNYEYIDTNYHIGITKLGDYVSGSSSSHEYVSAYGGFINKDTLTTSSFQTFFYGKAQCKWEAKGYIR